MWTGRVARLARSPRVPQVTTMQQAKSQCTVQHKVWWKPSNSTRNDSDENFQTRHDEPLVRPSGGRHVIPKVNQFFCCARSPHWGGHCSLCDARAEPQKPPHQVEKPRHHGDDRPVVQEDNPRATLVDYRSGLRTSRFHVRHGELCPTGAKTKIAASVGH